MFSRNVLQPLFKARLPGGAAGLQRGFTHRVTQLLEQHPEEQQHQHQESEENRHVQAQVPAPVQRQGQRGGRYKKFPGGRHQGKAATHPPKNKK